MNEYEMIGEFTNLEHSDLECALCMRFFYDPVSVSCGHTFCRPCLQLALESKKSCPMCRCNLDVSAADASRNEGIEDHIRRNFPEDYNERKKDAEKESIARAQREKRKLKLGENVEFRPDGSVDMYLYFNKGTLPFPGQPLTLFVHEIHYSSMITRCLTGSRCFLMVGDAERDSIGTVIYINDARILAGGQYLLHVHGIGRGIICELATIDIEVAGLFRAPVTACTDVDDTLDTQTNQPMISEETKRIVEEASKVLEQFFSSLDVDKKRLIRSRFGSPPRKPTEEDSSMYLEYLKKLSFWLPCAISLRRHGGEAMRMDLYRSMSMDLRLRLTCDIVNKSDANPAVARSDRHLLCGRRRLLDYRLPGPTKVLGKAGGMVILVFSLFLGISVWILLRRYWPFRL